MPVLYDNNKCTFVALLITYLTSARYSVQQAPDDADTLVAKVALDCASAKQVVSVIANDTDILIMLVCHYKPCMSDTFMSTKPGQSISSVAAIAKDLGHVQVSYQLFTPSAAVIQPHLYSVTAKSVLKSHHTWMFLHLLVQVTMKCLMLAVKYWHCCTGGK